MTSLWFGVFCKELWSLSCRFEDLGYPILAAWGVLVLRQLVEKRLFRAIGKYFGLQDRKRYEV